MKPLIIISPSINEDESGIKLSRAYFNAIRMAGGTALVSDYDDVERTIEIADGILFSGGGDIDPALSGDEADNENQGQISKIRDSFEFELLKKAVNKNIPILGICRGMQVIGAVYGAHIIQHIEGHIQEMPMDISSHEVNIKPNTLLYDIIGKNKIMVNSFHHQIVGSGFGGMVSAVSKEGYIEAIELKNKKFVLGVQWHPERLIESNENFSIFDRFIKEAKNRR